MKTLRFEHRISGTRSLATWDHRVVRHTVVEQRAMRRSTLRTRAQEPVNESIAEEAPMKALPSADYRYQDVGTCFVAGAGGKTGRRIVQQLADMSIPVRAMVRDGIKATSVLPGVEDGVDIVEGDVFKYQDVVQAMKGCNEVIIASGSTDRLDPLSPFKVDFQGVENIVAAAKQADVRKIVLISSIGADDPLFPLNLFGLVLVMKKAGELAVQRSGIPYTILRPGGLLNEEKDGSRIVIVGPQDYYGLPPRKRPGSILRSKVAEAAIAALVEPEAKNKIIEMISEKGTRERPWSEIFASVP